MFKNTSKNELPRTARLASTSLNSGRENHRLSNHQQTGILIVGHGSRRAEANTDVREAAHRIGERGAFALVEAAFLEIEHPNVAEGFARLVARGAREIMVHPYFLSPGRHTRGDLPREVGEAAALHPGVRYRLTEPLCAHPLVIQAAIERIEETRSASLPASNGKAELGTVYLVGAGPGDPELLTVRARNLMETSDCVLYDYLVNPEVLRLASPNADCIVVGKTRHGRCTPQFQINQMLIGRARAGQRVVRLKGGDPFLFGRGGEEADALHDAGIRFEIVPGVTSALAVPAYAGIPLTHRGHSSSVSIVTGAHAGAGGCSFDALSAVAAAETIVILMGISNLREITAHLMALHKSANTPTAVIQRGTYKSQQTIIGTLGSIADVVARAGLCAPAVIVIGETVRLRERLCWFTEAVPEISEGETAIAAA